LSPVAGAADDDHFGVAKIVTHMGESLLVDIHSSGAQFKLSLDDEPIDGLAEFHGLAPSYY